ncbi:MAG: single-stranded DNA-binding protein [Blastochloris sp.]|nr:single-stranded DNA-binding protein [Blastochloris sp.]
MATNVNRTELVGNLGNDPEARFSSTGTSIVTASIAVHSSYKQGDTWQERTDWFRLVAFGDAGEALNRFHKGERIRVVGRLQSSSYTDRDGKQRTSIELVVLHSEPAPLPRKGDDTPTDAETPAVEEPAPAPEAPAESAEAPAPKPAGARRSPRSDRTEAGIPPRDARLSVCL